MAFEGFLRLNRIWISIEVNLKEIVYQQQRRRQQHNDANDDDANDDDGDGNDGNGDGDNWDDDNGSNSNNNNDKNDDNNKDDDDINDNDDNLKEIWNFSRNWFFLSLVTWMSKKERRHGGSKAFFHSAVRSSTLGPMNYLRTNVDDKPVSISCFGFFFIYSMFHNKCAAN